jgi:predicted anti-sigma-YlaC factor YlaD
MGSACIAVRAQLEALVDGEVGERTSRLLRSHLSVCPECRALYASAASLPNRVAALPAPAPPPSLLAGVVHLVKRDRVRPLHFWGLFATEAFLVLTAAWYLSGVAGLLDLAGRTAVDVGGWIGWLAGQSAMPDPAAGDLFLLLICSVLLVVTILHLALLSRRGPVRSS